MVSSGMGVDVNAGTGDATACWLMPLDVGGTCFAGLHPMIIPPAVINCITIKSIFSWEIPGRVGRSISQCFSLAALVRIFNAEEISSLMLARPAGVPFSNSSRVLSRAPRIPLALCAQYESAETRSRRARSNCMSFVSSMWAIKGSTTCAGRTRNHQIRRLNVGRPTNNFTSILSILRQKNRLVIPTSPFSALSFIV